MRDWRARPDYVLLLAHPFLANPKINVAQWVAEQLQIPAIANYPWIDVAH